MNRFTTTLLLNLSLVVTSSLIFPAILKAQITIGKFYSPTNSDWLEIINNSEENIDFKEYLITDIANNKLTKDVKIPPHGNCVLDFSNRLNKSGDTIFLSKDGNQIDCVKYGDASAGECSNSREPESDTTKPDYNCFEPTPKPVQTSPSTSTPSPTEAPTQKPTSSSQILSATLSPTPRPIQKTKSKTPKPSSQPIPTAQPTDIVKETGGQGKQTIIASGMVSLGVIFIGAAIFPFVRQKY